jgi:hypothetical protein
MRVVTVGNTAIFTGMCITEIGMGYTYLITRLPNP